MSLKTELFSDFRQCRKIKLKNLNSDKFPDQKNLRILNQTIFPENLKKNSDKFLVQLAGQNSEDFSQGILIGTHFQKI